MIKHISIFLVYRRSIHSIAIRISLYFDLVAIVKVRDCSSLDIIPHLDDHRVFVGQIWSLVPKQPKILVLC